MQHVLHCSGGSWLTNLLTADSYQHNWTYAITVLLMACQLNHTNADLLLAIKKSAPMLHHCRD